MSVDVFSGFQLRQNWSFFARTFFDDEIALFPRIYHHQTTVQYASSWIWSRAKSLLHELNARGITIPEWLRNIKKPFLQARDDMNGRK